MADHDVAYTMAYTDPMSPRRDPGTGSLFQRCEARYGCPPLDEDGKRPDHKCSGRWFGAMDDGFNKNGTRRRVTVSAKTKSAAQRRLRDKLAEKHSAGKVARRTVTVAKWSEEWLGNIVKEIRPSAYETDRAAVRYIVKTIGSSKLADLTPAHVRSVANAIESEGKSSSTALRYHGSLMRLLKAAALDGYLISPNVLLTEAPSADVSNRLALPLADCLKVLAYITRRDEAGQLLMPDASRWAIAMLQGPRPSETLALTWPEVDLEAGTMTISWQIQSLRYVDRSDPSKGFRVPRGHESRQLAGATHLVRPKSKAGWRKHPLVPWALNTLRDWRDFAPTNEHQLVWPGAVTREGTWPRNAASDRAEWRRIQKAAGVARPDGKPYTRHEIRHSTASLLLALGVPEAVRIAIMGHSSIDSTAAYEHVDLSQMREALSGMAEMLMLE